MPYYRLYLENGTVTDRFSPNAFDLKKEISEENEIRIFFRGLKIVNFKEIEEIKLEGDISHIIGALFQLYVYTCGQGSKIEEYTGSNYISMYTDSFFEYNDFKSYWEYMIKDMGLNISFNGWYHFLSGFMRNLPSLRLLTKPKRISIKGTVRQNVLMRDNYTCQICGATVKDGAKLEIDHIKPVSKGGTNDENNLQVLCQQCNREKHNRDDLLHDKRKLAELEGK